MSTNPAVKIVEKPWGRELWLAHTDKYALKIIEVNKGTRSSLQYHERKHEHIYLDAGVLQVEWEDENGKWHQETAGGGDRPETDVEDSA